MAMPIPPSLSFEEAAALPEAWYTATQALVLIGKLKQGESVMVHAAGSGVGTAAIQIAKLVGAKQIIATAGSDAKLERCKALGATAVVNYKTTKFEEVVSRVTSGKGVDVLMDFIGASYWSQNLESLAVDGRMTIQGLMGGAQVEGSCYSLTPGMNLSVFLRKRITIHGTTLRARSLEYQIGLRDVFVEQILPQFESGQLKPIVDRVFKWTEIESAHELMQSNGNVGKIVVAV
ncbi:hypothetical protein HDU91_001748, partial [Kappamyces sp. JEL0680]